MATDIIILTTIIIIVPTTPTITIIRTIITIITLTTIIIIILIIIHTITDIIIGITDTLTIITIITDDIGRASGFRWTTANDLITWTGHVFCALPAKSTTAWRQNLGHLAALIWGLMFRRVEWGARLSALAQGSQLAVQAPNQLPTASPTQVPVPSPLAPATQADF
jgi:hypothetical protein